MNPNRILGIALLVGGVALMVFGINAMNSFSSDVSRFFTGSPTDKAVWMLIGGIVAGSVGLGLTLRASHRT
jgi:hypothetical protein